MFTSEATVAANPSDDDQQPEPLPEITIEQQDRWLRQLAEAKREAERAGSGLIWGWA